MRALDFTQSMGVVTHLNYTDGGYADIAADLKDLAYLGINHVRDESPNPSYDPFGQGHLGDAANAGVKFVFFAQGGVDPSVVVQRLHDFVAAHPGSISGIEGPNEVNNWPVSYHGLNGSDAAQAYQSALFSAVKSDPLLHDIPVLGFTDYPLYASASDLNNTHPYSENGAQPRAAILAGMTDQAAVDPGKPFAITESGYNTLPGSGGREGVDEATQAKLLLNTYADAAQLGSRETDVYSLLDAYPDPSGTSQESHYGLFRLDQSPKPAATAIHNLTSILQDSGSDAASFSPGSLDYSVSGLSDTGHTSLIEKSNGSFQVMIWNELPVWDPVSHQPIANSSTSVTVNLGQNFGTVEVFDPLQSADAVQILHNVSTLNLGLSDHPLIVQASSASGVPDVPPGQTSTVTDPPAATAATSPATDSTASVVATPATQTSTVTDPPAATAATSPATDSTTGAVATPATQTSTVTDPPAATAATSPATDSTTGAVATPATQTSTVTDPPAATAATSPSSGTSPSAAMSWSRADHDHANGHDHSFASAANSPSPADHGHENGHDHSFALLSQYLAGGFHGQVDHGQIAMAASHAGSWLNESILTRPQH
jgi:hypothetical protein